MGVRSTTVTASVALLLCATLTSCTADEAPEQEVDSALLELERAADALSVTILRPGAERAFARKGHPVDGSLSCSAVTPSAPSAEPPEEPDESDEDALTAGEPEEIEAGEDTAEDNPQARGGRLEVLCTGQSRDGEEIRFEGRLLREALAGREDGDDGLRGEFTGLVDEEEVFAMDCFQCPPANSQPPEAQSPETQSPEPSGSPDAPESSADTD